jgi:putative secretion ATPase (PEP-CTERM system associated)
MYEEFYGLNRLPFQLLPDPDFFYRSREHDKALSSLEYGIFERAGFVVITGEIGTGKTTLLRNMLRSLNQDIPIALLNQTFLPPEDFLRTLCQEFSLPYEGKEKSELIELFGAFLVDQYKEGRYVILILDEAQNFPLDTLEEIRMLSNLDADSERLLQIILVGQPSLRGKLQRQELRQLLQRVEVSYHLKPLDREEIKEYIHYRLATAGAEDPELFDESAIEPIFNSTGGVPRLINLICHRCLVYGFAESQKKISHDLLEEILEDRKAEGLYPEAGGESSTRNQEAIDEPSDFTENPEPVDSQPNFTAALNRLSEISGASMRAVELAASKSSNRTEEKFLAVLNKQLAEERQMRETLERRLARTEDALVRMGKVPSETIHEDQDRSSANADSHPISQSKSGQMEIFRSLFAAKISQPKTILFFLIIVLLSFAILMLWRSAESDKSEQRPKRKSAVSEFEVTQPKIKKKDIDLNQTVPEKPLDAEANSVGQPSIFQTTHSAGSNSQIVTKRENPATLLLPVKTSTKNLSGMETPLLAAVKPKRYICIVELANVRAGPNMNAPVVRRIAQGTKVNVIGEKGNWMQLKSEKAPSSWIHSSLLRRQN